MGCEQEYGCEALHIQYSVAIVYSDNLWFCGPMKWDFLEKKGTNCALFRQKVTFYWTTKCGNSSELEQVFSIKGLLSIQWNLTFWRKRAQIVPFFAKKSDFIGRRSTLITSISHGSETSNLSQGQYATLATFLNRHDELETTWSKAFTLERSRESKE